MKKTLLLLSLVVLSFVYIVLLAFFLPRLEFAWNVALSPSTSADKRQQPAVDNCGRWITNPESGCQRGSEESVILCYHANTRLISTCISTQTTASQVMNPQVLVLAVHSCGVNHCPGKQEDECHEHRRLQIRAVIGWTGATTHAAPLLCLCRPELGKVINNKPPRQRRVLT